MKIKFGVFAFFLICILAFSNGGLLYAQESGDAVDAASDGDGVFIELNDNELASFLTSVPNPNAVVRPLVQIKWGQGSPYNNLFPMLPGHDRTDSSGRLITGCGNTARAQLKAFHRHPARGRGTSTFVRSSNIATVPSVNLNVAYDWNNMLNSYRGDGRDSSEQQRNAVAVLNYHTALARGATNGNHPVAFTEFFGYDKSIQWLQRRFYTDAEWEAIIRQQLDAGLPVYYAGNHPGSSHAFIVDGYDSTGRFHMNWGWNGRHDGWYSLDNLNPRGRREWYNNQNIMIDIKPDAGGAPAGWEMALRTFTSSKTHLSQNEQFTVTIRVRNNAALDSFPGGHFGIALVDNNGGIIEVIGNRSRSALNPRSTSSSRDIDCSVSGSVRPGQYRLMAVIRPTNGEWRVITRSAIGDGIPSVINVTVTEGRAAQGGGYGMAVTRLAASKTSVVHNEQFTVTVRLRNISSQRFPGGNYNAALVNDAGVIVAIIRTAHSSASARDPGAQSSVSEMICAVPDSVRPGRYQLRAVVRTSGNEWRIVTDSYNNTPTSIDFTVR
jgi:hypothetical protein